MPLFSSLRKVPEITLVFWIVKSLTTAMGESTSDFLVLTIDPYVAVGLGGIGLVLALLLQFSVRRYVPWIYWLTVVMVAIFGTMAADGLHVQLGVPYLISSAAFAIALAVIFIAWKKSEKTLSIHSITNRRREGFYWATVLATFALGTAVSDVTAFTLHLGYVLSIFLFGLVITVIAIAHARFRLNGIVAFWAAYILTRPFGASIADWIGKPFRIGGLGLGDGPVSLGLALLIVLFIGYMTFDKREIKLENTISRSR